MNGDFLRKKIESAGFQLVEVAKKLDISPQDLQSKLKSNDVKVSFLEKIAFAINENVYSFFDLSEKPNIQNKLYNKNITNSITNSITNEKYIKSDTLETEDISVMIPLYDDVVVGGMQFQASLHGQTEPAEYINAGDWFRDATAAMRVHGDSMFPEYKSGSIVALKLVNNKQLVIYGQDYVIETEEYRVIKRLQRSDDKTCWLLASINTEEWANGMLKGRLIHEPFDVPVDKVTQCFRVLGCVTRTESSRIVLNEHHINK